MLIYIPTITMGIWADERKQGTDELLLTIPARDFDIVLGKYLAAVAIFSVSLLFSLVCNYLVLNNLASTDAGFALAPQLDIGLFLARTSATGWSALAMLAIGVVASFLTSNITIGFVLGVLFNMPLVFLAAADAIFGSAGQQVVLAIKRWSISQRFADFSRGVLTPRRTGLFRRDPGGHALREHGADRPAALVQRAAAAGRWPATTSCGRWPWWWSRWRVGDGVRPPRPAARRDQRAAQFALARRPSS